MEGQMTVNNIQVEINKYFTMSNDDINKNYKQ